MSQPVELKEQIEELALRMVMADPEGPAAALACLSAIESIRDAAARGQVPAVRVQILFVPRSARESQFGEERAPAQAGNQFCSSE